MKSENTDEGYSRYLDLGRCEFTSVPNLKYSKLFKKNKRHDNK